MTSALDPDRLAQLRHDLRTPLNHLIGYGEMLLEDARPDANGDVANALNNALAQARRMLTLINGLSGQQVSRDHLARLSADLEAPLRATVEALEDAKRATPPAQSTLHADLDRMSSAALNLRAVLDAGLLDQNTPAAPARAPERGIILVVDDDEGNRDLLGRRLERDGHAVQQASNGREALEKLRAGDVSVVLLDVRMPELDGYQVLQEIKRDPALRHTPVLMISAVDEIESVVRCIELGAEDYLPKPFNPVLLRARIGACLEKKRLRDQEARQARELARWNEQLAQRVAEQVTLLDRLGRLKRFFSPQLAELIVAGGAVDPLKTHRREITVCFLDLRGFTAFAESAEPEEVMGVLREYHAEMGKLILRHEGTLERFTGDGMMIFFNDPVPVPDASLRALRMALEMRARVTELVGQWLNLGYELDLGIGIAQGFATIGAIGFEGRWDYGAIGSVTNLAARLCAEAKAGEILISQRVRVAAGDGLQVRAAGELSLKGFAKAIPAFHVVELK